MSKTSRFETVLQQRGKGAWVPVPFDPNERWGDKDKHYITGSIGKFSFRGTVDYSSAGDWGISLGEACVRGLPIPETSVAVELTPEGPQVDELADDIKKELEAEPTAARFFASLATFYRKGFINPIEEAKRPETRKARIDTMMSALKSGRRER